MMAFLTAQPWLVLKSLYTAGAQNEDFGAGLKADLTRGLHCSFVWCRLIIMKACRYNCLIPSLMFIFFSSQNYLNICMWPLIQKKNKIIGQNLLKKCFFSYDPRPGGELVAGEDEIDGLKRSMTEVCFVLICHSHISHITPCFPPKFLHKHRLHKSLSLGTTVIPSWVCKIMRGGGGCKQGMRWANGKLQ